MRFQEQGVNQQDWTQLDPRTWRLDGVDTQANDDAADCQSPYPEKR